MKDTVRYWTGSEWSEHYGCAPAATLPAPAAATPPRTQPKTEPKLQRNVHIWPFVRVLRRGGRSAGNTVPALLRRVHALLALQNVASGHTRKKFVGVPRGGRSAVHDCRECGKQLTGPRM